MASQRVLGSVFMELPFGGNGKILKVEVKNLILISNGHSEEELQKLDIDKFVEEHLYVVAEQRGSLSGFRQVLQEGRDTIVCRDVFLRKSEAQVKSGLVANQNPEVTPPPTWLLARPR